MRKESKKTSVQLFPHNQTAYNSALEMLESRGKTAIVHPTGTGKSFIGFKLCEDNPDKSVCWLSPSEYIFKTQLENLKKADGDKPRNIRFYTYAKLMLMSEEEMSGINPSYIVLDEFHRCGAEMWAMAFGDYCDFFLTPAFSDYPPPRFAIWIISVIWFLNCLMAKWLPK